jgi:hypothetical protein
MRLSFALLLLALLVGVAACGGAEPQTRSGIPAGVAERLAARSDAVADALDSGDECGAAHEADDLRSAADQAIASGVVPAELQAELESAVTELQNEVNCPPPEPKKEHPRPEKGEKKSHKKHEDTTSTTITIETTTEEDG